MPQNRNAESHFLNSPVLDIKRSKLKIPHGLKTTFNCGDLVPLFVDADIMPGTTVEIDMASVIRGSTPIYPVLDNANIDIYWFFVPHRLVWNHWKEFWGENNTTHWEQPTEYTIPQITSPEGGWTKGTLADYMGIPTNISNLSVNSLPFRAYAKIVNDWFISENLQDPCMMNIDDSTIVGTNSGDYVTNVQKGAKPFKAGKYADFYTSCLPSAQKGPAVQIPLGDKAPVITGAENHAIANNPLTWLQQDGTKTSLTGTITNVSGQVGSVRTGSQQYVDGTQYNSIVPANLYADLTNAVGATVNMLRMAFSVQKFYERLALGGSRYTEIVRSLFGTTSPDARQQRAEYLGGLRQPINIDQVLQTSSTDATSPQGNTAAYSLTSFSKKMVVKSFTEHGTLMCLGVVRTMHSYQQGLHRQWTRKKMLDFYNPIFANLGEMPVLNEQIYAQGTAEDKEAFGYQEAWAEYRYRPNLITGAFRSNYAQSLDSWHYGDDYESLPTLSSSWLMETEANVNRTLAVQSELEDQYIADFYFDNTYVVPMPVYSIPGLIDHH